MCADLKEQQGNKSIDFWNIAQSIKTHILALQRIANVTAIEFVEVFVLDYSSFKKYVQTNGTIMQKLSDVAELRMKLTLKKEEELKRQLKEEGDRESYADPKANSI